MLRLLASYSIFDAIILSFQHKHCIPAGLDDKLRPGIVIKVAELLSAGSTRAHFSQISVRTLLCMPLLVKCIHDIW